MRKCPYCSRAVVDAAVFCDHCGRELPALARSRGPRSLWVGSILLVVLVLVGGWWLFVAPRRVMVMPSGSMEPTIPTGSRFTVNTRAYSGSRIPERGDIIMFGNPHGLLGCSDQLFVKRVIALPDETIEVREGRAFVDGAQLDEPYLHPEIERADYGPLRVPPDHVFLMGDNRARSYDSRSALGPVPLSHVCGKVVRIFDG